MKKPKILCLCLAMLVAVVSLAAIGCGSNSSTSGETAGGNAGTGADRSYVIAACRANMRTLDTAAQTYFASTGNWPRSLNDLVPGYVRAQSLQCPAGGNYGFRISNDQVIIVCPNGHTL